MRPFKTSVILRKLREDVDMPSFIAGFLIGAIFFAVVDFNVHHTHDFKQITCQFKNMTAHYYTSVEEANSQTMMITVTQADRTFMFRRDNLTACYDANETP